jgi:hypothetical protein
MMEKNPEERKQILKEMTLIAEYGNEHFMSTPLMI